MGDAVGPARKLTSLSFGTKTRAFSQDASIALIGMRGAGKSTLAIIASASLKLKLVDTERCFRTLTGLCVSDYTKLHGRSAFHAKEVENLKHILQTHPRNSIIAVSSSSSESSHGRRLLEEFALSHPVIHITRDSCDLIRYLAKHISEMAATRMSTYSIPWHRSAANFEFCTKNFEGSKLHSENGQTPTFLSLKDAEYHFLGFLRFIYGRPRHENFLMPPEETDFSRIAMIPFPFDEHDFPDITAVHGVHAIGIQLDIRRCAEMDLTTLLDRISAVYTHFRWSCECPLAIKIEYAFHDTTSTIPSAELYFGLLNHAVGLGIDYCYVDFRASKESIVQFMKTRAATKIIGVWKEFNANSHQQRRSQWWESAECISVYDSAVELGFDIVQISGEADSMEDNFAALSFAQLMRRPQKHPRPAISVFNYGKNGKMSRLLNRTMVPVELPLLRNRAGGELQPQEQNDMTTLAEVQNALIQTCIVPHLAYCSFGQVIAHSVAPAMHNAAFAALGLPHNYAVLESNNLTDCLPMLRSSNFGGLSCANPHKEAAMGLMDHVSAHAQAIRAINTVYQRTSPLDGMVVLHGENTDWIGVTSCILKYLSPLNTVTRKTTVLIIGAGGMARAAVYACLRLGVMNIMIYNRTQSNAEAVAGHFLGISDSIQEIRNKRDSKGAVEGHDRGYSPVTITVLDSSQATESLYRPMAPPTIIINALPDGECGKVSSDFDIPLGWFSRSTGGVYIESAYKRGHSILMGKVSNLTSQNWVGVTGKELLLEQAFAQIELWTGLPAPRDVMRKAILQVQ
ncbi:hypothetical protein BKA64DRAFT_586101 [Cadophora sp. MPI-SDFR-AT-0126]|nr:hypothetical protein BKA64DRAFT_586101 [Leotiomycetes sp. MPI-SDFR-AT-0126]